MKADHIVVLITTDSQEEVNKLSRGLVESKLAFCVNSIPGIQSTYFWEGKLCVDNEFLLIVKTRANRFDDLKLWVEKNHSYDVPEVIALPIVDGLDSYLQSINNWVPEK